VASLALGVGIAVLLWWGSTAALLWLANRHGHRGASLGILSLIYGVAWVLALQLGSEAGRGPWIASFMMGLLIWGWLEFAYLAGAIAGPLASRKPCPPGLEGWTRFKGALMTGLWHELAVVATLALLWLGLWDAPNALAAQSFTVLAVARWSAKLNVYLGVPNLHGEFFPEHMRYLVSWTRKRPMNSLFPFSITVGTGFTILLVGQALTAPMPAQALGSALLGALVALAVLEHWFLVINMDDGWLWRWALPRRPSASAEEATPTAWVQAPQEPAGTALTLVSSSRP
jgi:putative photosynthetic complex assembly protein 2